MINDIKTEETIEGLQLQMKKLHRLLVVQENRISRSEMVISTRGKFMEKLKSERMEQEKNLKQAHEVISDKEKELEKALIKAQAASKAKSNFLANMSHEMRTPMNVIIGMTAVGLMATDPERKNLALRKIEDASTHLLAVINDVLDMAKIEEDKMELSPVEYNFGQMLKRVLVTTDFRIDEKKQKMTVYVDSNIPMFLVGDDKRIAQVITNLLSNAIKFTPEGGEISLEVNMIKETDDECELRIEVTDSGIGVSDEQKEKIFIAFEQTDAGVSRKFGGSGLGLPIAKRIIELMGGSIWVESELGSGAKFIFTAKARKSDEDN